jgi:hypothetical protein
MTHALRLLARAAAPLFVLVALAGCDSSRLDAPLAPEARIGAPGAALQLGGSLDASLLLARTQGKNAHPYFPIVPGEYKDYRVTLAGEPEPRYLRVTTGAPELFFERMATPLVYSEIPGMISDTVFVGLRQFFSISPVGDLWFHGAANKGVMSHTEPPVRQLLAHPKPGEAWSDTVFFESFLPGMVLFLEADYLYEWTLSERARLTVPAGTFRAVRATSVIYDAPPVPGGASVRAGAGMDELAVRFGVALKPHPVDILKGYWFARHVGIVARDWPFGDGPENSNVRTMELIGEGVGPVPPPTPPPPPPNT